MSDDHTHRATLRRIAHRAMLERGLEPDFSPAVTAELAQIGARLEPAAGVRDLRHLSWSSIDNDDSLDLDQLTVAQALPGGAVRVLVAVADVDARVAKGSAVDAHAQTNTTSVYTAAEVFPMLPERLSTDLSSLAERQDRPAVVVEMTIREDGSMVGADLYQALVHNHAKLAYDSVAAWLEGDGSSPEAIAAVPGLDATLRLQDAAAQKLRALRHEHGALDLKTVEARAVFDADRIQDLAAQEKNRAKELIEDLMIAANGVTARFLAGKGFPVLRRMVRTPKRWDRIVELAAEVDERLPAAPDARSLALFLARRRAADPLRFPDLSLSVVKLLGAGEYAVDLPEQDVPGHFGLAVKDYTHSTAPNRRFPDLSRSAWSRPRSPGRSRPTAPTSSSRSPLTARPRKTPPTRWSVRSPSRRRRCCCPRTLGSASTRSSPAPRPRAPGCASSSHPSKGRWSRAPPASTWAAACGSNSSAPTWSAVSSTSSA